MKSNVRVMPRAFTLIELMIVVAILGIISAIAIPSYLKFGCKAKRGEVPPNMMAIRASLEAHLGEKGFPSASTSQLVSTCGGADLPNIAGAGIKGGTPQFAFYYTLYPSGSAHRYFIRADGCAPDFTGEYHYFYDDSPAIVRGGADICAP